MNHNGSKFVPHVVIGWEMPMRPHDEDSNLPTEVYSLEKEILTCVATRVVSLQRLR